MSGSTVIAATPPKEPFGARAKPGDVVYVTKWALTQGILQTVVHPRHEVTGDYVLVRFPGGMNGMHLSYASDTAFSVEEAQSQVRLKARAKIRSLEKMRERVLLLEQAGAEVHDILPAARSGGEE